MTSMTAVGPRGGRARHWMVDQPGWSTYPRGVTTVRVHEAKAQLSALLARVEAGEEIIVARGNVEVAKIVPLRRAGSRELGFVNYSVPDTFFDPLPEAELAAWEE